MFILPNITVLMHESSLLIPFANNDFGTQDINSLLRDIQLQIEAKNASSCRTGVLIHAMLPSKYSTALSLVFVH